MYANPYRVWRNGAFVLATADQLQSHDLVLTDTGTLIPATTVLRRPTTPAWSAGEQLVVAGLVIAAAWLITDLFTPTKPANVRTRRNDDPLEAWKKDYVCERDHWQCTYCGRRVTRGTRHIDHSVSRRNGGSNHLNNLRTACRACNLAKGARNARQFRVA